MELDEDELVARREFVVADASALAAILKENFIDDSSLDGKDLVLRLGFPEIVFHGDKPVAKCPETWLDTVPEGVKTSVVLRARESEENPEHSSGSNGLVSIMLAGPDVP